MLLHWGGIRRLCRWSWPLLETSLRLDNKFQALFLILEWVWNHQLANGSNQTCWILLLSIHRTKVLQSHSKWWWLTVLRYHWSHKIIELICQEIHACFICCMYFVLKWSIRNPAITAAPLVTIVKPLINVCNIVSYLSNNDSLILLR